MVSAHATLRRDPALGEFVTIVGAGASWARILRRVAKVAGHVASKTWLGEVTYRPSRAASRDAQATGVMTTAGSRTPFRVHVACMTDCWVESRLITQPSPACRTERRRKICCAVVGVITSEHPGLVRGTPASIRAVGALWFVGALRGARQAEATRNSRTTASARPSAHPDQALEVDLGAGPLRERMGSS